MSLQVGGVDHQCIGLAALGRQSGEDLVEHPKPAPADEAIVDRLVRAIVLGRVAPSQAVSDHKDDPADHPAVVDPRNPMGQREIGLNPPHLGR